MKDRSLMMQVKRVFAAERINAPDYVLVTLLAAVATVLLTRAILHVTGYPQLAPGGLHIAHILYGGVLMFGAGLVTLSYHGRVVKYVTAVMLGAGFGLFVDEAGKFLTHDNNYFYRPTVIVIYGCFLVIFYVYRLLKQTETKAPRSLLYQAFEEMEEIIESDFEPDEKKRALASLDQVVASKQEPLATFARRLKMAIDQEPVRPDHMPKLVEVYLRWRRLIYGQTLRRKWVVPVLAGVFGVYGLISLVATGYQIVSDPSVATWEKLLAQGVTPTNTNVVMFTVQMATKLVVSVLIVVGLWKLRKNRLAAMNYFYKALIVRIMLADVFTFYFEQFSAAVAVCVDILVLAGINHLIEEEKKQEIEKVEASRPSGDI